MGIVPCMIGTIAPFPKRERKLTFPERNGSEVVDNEENAGAVIGVKQVQEKSLNTKIVVVEDMEDESNNDDASMEAIPCLEQPAVQQPVAVTHGCRPDDTGQPSGVFKHGGANGMPKHKKIGVEKQKFPLSNPKRAKEVLVKKGGHEIFSWNCHGASHDNFCTAFRSYMSSFSPDIAILVEPRVSGSTVENVCRQLGFENYLRVEAVGFSGGIWVL
ncbi:hypothetical protein LINPERHAP2_LOCUS38439 [Linum perenne]